MISSDRDFAGKDTQELNTLLREARSALYDAQMKVATQQMMTHTVVKKTRRRIARILTTLQSRQK